MSTLAIFYVGVAMTLMCGSAIALVVWTAVQDGRTQRAEDEQRPHAQDETVGRQRPRPAGAAEPAAHRPR